VTAVARAVSAGDYLDAMLDRHGRAERGAGAVVHDLRVAGRGVRLRFAGEGLVPCVLPALAHLAATFDGPAELTVHLWDSESTGVPMLPAPFAATPGGNQLPGGRIDGFTGARHHAACNPETGSFSLLDREAGVAAIWVRGPGQPDRHERAAPLKHLFAGAWSASGLQMVHAAALGDARGGLLLGGRGGSGKSTTAVLCLEAGLGFAGDDYCLVDAERAYGVYATAKLVPERVGWVPGLAAAFDAPPPGEKAIAFLAGHPGLRPSMPLRALVLPAVTGVAPTRLVPLAPAAAVRGIAPSSVLQSVGTGAGNLALLAGLARRLPCWRLELGPDRDAIPGVLAELLA
jgi:hypothetical protein